MKRTQQLNSHLSSLIARVGHTHRIVVCDAGLPVPDGPELIDLAVTTGIPSFMDVLKTIATELQIERIQIATEIEKGNPSLYAEFKTAVSAFEKAQGKPITLETIPHEAFKAASAEAKAIVRTGECTPYANVILHCGVPF